MLLVRVLRGWGGKLRQNSLCFLYSRKVNISSHSMTVDIFHWILLLFISCAWKKSKNLSCVHVMDVHNFGRNWEAYLASESVLNV